MRECQEMGCTREVEDDIAVCKGCLLGKGQGRREPPKEPPTFHVKGETVVVPATYEPPAIIESSPLLPDEGYLAGSVEQATRTMAYVHLCSELGIIAHADPKATVLSYVRGLRQQLEDAQTNFHTAAVELEDLRQKAEGATPIKGTPPAELEPVRAPVESTGHTRSMQGSIDLLARQVASITLVLGGMEGALEDTRRHVARIASHLGVKR